MYKLKIKLIRKREAVGIQLVDKTTGRAQTVENPLSAAHSIRLSLRFISQTSLINYTQHSEDV
jgi:hypothetical protein